MATERVIYLCDRCELPLLPGIESYAGICDGCARKLVKEFEGCECLSHMGPAREGSVVTERPPGLLNR